MIFSLYFFLFLLFVLLPWPLIRQTKWRGVYLSSISMIFIGFFDLTAIPITIIAAFLAHWGARSNKRPSHKNNLYPWIIGAFVSLLIAAKIWQLHHSGIAPTWLATGPLPWNHLVVPLGLSYLLFKVISYMMDVRWGLVEPGRFDEVLAYCSLFTIFTAGPIERFEHFLPQLRQPAQLTDDDRRDAMLAIAWGIFQKLALANSLASIRSHVESSLVLQNLSFVIEAGSLILYTFQLYFDFAGYSNLAIGTSALFGFKVLPNFDRPYLSVNIGQFWQRWHISLSSWIRSYLFFPLSQLSTNRIWLSVGVPIIAMGLCGLWHGFAWNFLVWGVWHGVGLAGWQKWSVYLRKHKHLIPMTKTKWYRTCAQCLTFVWVCLGWWWFKWL
jgi:alginate O-acetyltransferase complex protein AlgI